MLQTDDLEDPILNPEQVALIEKANSFNAEFWFTLVEWTKSKDLLTPLERKKAFNQGQMRARNKLIKLTNKQLVIAQEAIKIIEKAREAGF